jgi:ribosomal protein S18 acetylase RimI-like enzyme
MPGKSSETSVLGRIEEYVRRYATVHREVERVGPFLATFGLHSSGPYLNYAVPDDGCEPTAAEVSAMIDAYERRRLRPRVELVASLAPGALAALGEAGFLGEGVYSLMSASADSLHGGPFSRGIEVVFAHRDDQYATVLEVRQEAFCEPDPVTSSDIARVRSSVEQGGAAVLAIETASGDAVGSGSCLVPYDLVTELVSIGVSPRWRRLGVGATMTAALAGAALASGSEMVYVTAVHNDGERVYERVGFAVNGQLVHLGL